ncbi:hypothetical protein [Bryobacter aggregatus]|uniref:hypothetical protein n=1 Tax=Bryobacter aggregatus TaxID=360054 RepID=UPI0004E0F00B|nr:hypothetical protein [Bryobacter aggregatus]
MRRLIWLICVSCLWGEDELESNRERIRVSLTKLLHREKTKADLLYVRRLEKRELGPNGEVKSSTVNVTRRDPWEEQVVVRLLSKDDKPLPPEEVQKQEERLRKLVAEYRKNPPESKMEEAAWLTEMPDALDFQCVGTEQHKGRKTDIYAFTPKAGYKAKHARARAFEKINGKVWIDDLDNEVTRLEVFVFDTINIGFGMLGKVEKGTNYEMSRKKWDAGLWYEEWQRVRFDVRVMMVKTIRQEIETRWSNLKVRPPVKALGGGGL